MASNKLSVTTMFIIGIAAALAAVIFILVLVPKNDYNYNGYVIQKGTCPGSTVLCWFAEFNVRGQPYVMTFYYHPSQVDNITVVPDTLKVTQLATVANSTLYITVPNNVPGKVGVAAIEITRVLGKRYNLVNLNVKTAVYGTGPDQISCGNASGNTVVMSFEQGTIDAVFVRSTNCIVVSATDAERAVAVADAYAYRLIGVIYTPQQNSTASSPSTAQLPIPINYIPPNSTNS